MQRVNVTINGKKPLIINKFNIESIQSMNLPETGKAGDNPEEWKTSFFHQDGKLYVPGNYIFSCLKKGSVYTKVGRGTIQSTWISAIIVEDEIISINRQVFDGWEEKPITEVPTDPINPVYVDIRMVANPNTKGRNVRYRLACSPGWELSFSLLVDDTLISIPQVKKVIEDTGKLIGLADARTLGYGRFDLISFENKKIESS